MSSPLSAANAYGAALRMLQGGDGGSAGFTPASVPGGPVAGAGPSFGGALSSTLSNAVASVGEAAKRGDASTLQAAGGNANLVDVVTAVAESEAAIETLVSVRDKVISAYEEIMRMPI